MTHTHQIGDRYLLFFGMAFILSPTQSFYSQMELHCDFKLIGNQS